MRFFILAILFLSTPVLADGKKQTYDLVCFDSKGLDAVLDKVVNEQQILNTDFRQTVKIGKFGCDIAVIPSGSQVRRLGFYQKNKDFIFIVYEVRYSTTGQRMYAVDGVLATKNWNITERQDNYVGAGTDRFIILPKTCRGTEGYSRYVGLLTGNPNEYVVIPDRCRIQTIR